MNEFDITESENTPQNPFDLLEKGIYSALETYSNVHRGSGQKSMITTRLIEEARLVVLDYFGLSKSKYCVIFSSPRYAEILKMQIRSDKLKVISSAETGLPIGVRAIVVRKNELPGGEPLYGGGGTARLISTDWIIWARGAAKFEAGTPSIINIIALARALQIMKKFGKNIFMDQPKTNTPVSDIINASEYKEYNGKKLLEQIRASRIGKNIMVPALKGNSKFINFDSSASTPTFEPIWRAFKLSLTIDLPLRKQIITDVRKTCEKFIGAPLSEYDIVFTSNTTEAINIAAENLGIASEKHAQTKIITSLLEHSSNELPWRLVSGHTVIHLNVDEYGNLDLKDLESKLERYNSHTKQNKKQVSIVALSAASNVLGAETDIKEISSIVHKYGAHLLVDAAQLIAHKKINMKESGIDMLAFSSHKIYAPFGSGALILKKGLNNFSDSEFQAINQSGEENIAGIAALGSALSILMNIGMETIEKEESRLTRLALQGLVNIDGLEVYGITDSESSLFSKKIGVIPFNFNKILSFKAGKLLALRYGIGVRVGCHCAHIIVKHILNVSPGLEKFQRIIQSVFPKLKFPGLVRVSLGLETTDGDVQKLLSSLNQISVNSKTDSKNFAELKKQLKGYYDAKAEQLYNV